MGSTAASVEARATIAEEAAAAHLPGSNEEDEVGRLSPKSASSKRQPRKGDETKRAEKDAQQLQSPDGRCYRVCDSGEWIAGVGSHVIASFVGGADTSAQVDEQLPGSTELKSMYAEGICLLTFGCVVPDGTGGCGWFACSWKAYDKENGLEVAWHEVGLEHVASEKFEQQLVSMKDLRHEHVVEVKLAWTDEARNIAVFVTEMLSAGTLHEYAGVLWEFPVSLALTSKLATSFMLRAGSQMRVTLLKKWCRQILQGLQYMHAHTPPVIHRDLRLENIFVDGRTGDIRIGNIQLALAATDLGAMCCRRVVVFEMCSLVFGALPQSTKCCPHPTSVKHTHLLLTSTPSDCVYCNLLRKKNLFPRPQRKRTVRSCEHQRRYQLLSTAKALTRRWVIALAHE